jgi:hypothetical protein
VLFGQDCADEPCQCCPVGKDADDVGAAADLPIEPFLGIVEPDLAPRRRRERGESQDVGPGAVKVLPDGGKLVGQLSWFRTALTCWSAACCGVRDGAVLGELIAAAEQRGHASMDRSQCCIAIGLDLLTIDADWFQRTFGVARLLRHVTEHRVSDSLGR